VEILIEQENRTDHELIDAANEGESTAFEAIYSRYRDWAATLAFRFTNNHDLAMDVLQETFVYLAKKFPGFALTCQMKSFLYPVIKNLSITASLKANRYQSGEELFAHLEAPAEKTASEEGLRSALSSLPESQREVVVLRFLEEMSLEEIADALDVPLGTVKSRLHNALKALRDDPKTKYLLE
jgi:RNA polymerase sigma-70 factor (ECF subfamily)